MKKSIFVSTLVAATALAVPAFADELTWTGSNGDSWTGDTSWDSSTWVSGSDATFTSTGAGTVNVTDSVTAGTVTIGDAYTFNISGTLTTGQITISGGSLALTGSGKLAATTGSGNGDALVVDASSFTGTLEVNGWLDAANSTLTNSATTIVLDTTGGSSDYYGSATSITYGTVSVSSATTYTIAASLQLSGEGGVILRTNSSNVTVNITGNVTGSSAELQINGGGNANFSGTVDLGTYITYQGATTFSGESTTLGTLEFSNDGGGTNASSVTFTSDASVGAITVDTTKSSAFTDSLTVSNSATLTVGSISLGADSLEVTASEGTMIVTGDISATTGSLSIGSGSTVTATGTTAAATRASLVGISGAGTLEINDGSETPSSKEFIVTTSDDFTGNVYIKSGRLNATSSIAEDATLTLVAGGTLQSSGNTYENAVSITFSSTTEFDHDITIEGTGAIQIRTGGTDIAGTLSGDITAADAAYLQINGGNSVTLSGNVTMESGGYINYQGSTTFTGTTVTLGSLDIIQTGDAVSNVTFSGSTASVGTLTVDAAAGTATPTLTVSNGASLSVGTLAVSHNLAITIDNATLSITTSATQSSSDISTSIVISNGGQLNVGSDVTLNVDAMEIILSTDNMNADTAILTGSGSIPNSVIVLTVDSALDQLFREQGEGEYTFNLYDTSLSLSSTMFVLDAFDEYGYAYFDNYGNFIVVVDIPEPSMFGLFFGLGAIGLVATRRRRRR